MCTKRLLRHYSASTNIRVCHSAYQCNLFTNHKKAKRSTRALSTYSGFRPFGILTYRDFDRHRALTFQRFMYQATRDLDFCFAYLDDVLVANQTAQEREVHLAELFHRFVKYGVKVNPLRIEPGTSGFPSIYRGYSTTASEGSSYRAAAVLLTLLDRLISSKPGNQEIHLPPEAVEAFERSKQALAGITLLYNPAESANLSLVVAAKGGWPLAASFLFRAVFNLGRRYIAFGRELLAAYLAIHHFRYLLEGRHFAMVTGHKPLVQAILSGSTCILEKSASWTTLLPLPEMSVISKVKEMQSPMQCQEFPLAHSPPYLIPPKWRSWREPHQQIRNCSIYEGAAQP
ncbi:hypothetical protein M513_06101 [Trichuris suis]|uniref:Reverse transcriptase RNase H-like domain-containing protein n=1 Tax=Trichuris suis TaxID=68888 RepID=A0A085M6Y9_9BILA|nr:hypothetical protein M513_06101 [Trichuris suis]